MGWMPIEQKKNCREKIRSAFFGQAFLFLCTNGRGNTFVAPVTDGIEERVSHILHVADIQPSVISSLL